MPTTPPDPNQQAIDKLEARRIILTQKRDRLNTALAECERQLAMLTAPEASELNA